MTDINSKYKKLTDVEHCLVRPGRYIGSIVPKTATTYTLLQAGGQKMVQKEITWNPGFLKLFDEIISNSVDHSKRPEGAGLDTIKVDIDQKTGIISIFDNGGIPIIVHSEYNEYLPTMLLGYLRSGSNFDDTEESDLTGQNGEGASLTNIFSTNFTVESCDGKKKFKQVWTDNMMKADPADVSDAQGAKGFTRITYLPDYAHLGMTLDEGNYAKLVKRVYDIAGCNPKLKIYLNGDRIKIASFKDYIEMYTDKFEYDDNGDWQIGVAPSDNGFEHVSFVNSTETAQGGTHIPYVMYQIAIALRQYIEKKHKIDVLPNVIQQHMRLFINARIIRPRYDSQTKENLITEQREFKTAWECSEKFMKKVRDAGIVDRVLLWAETRAKMLELQALRDVNKSVEKVDPRRVEKFSDANEDTDRHLCELYLTEGDCIDENTEVKCVVDGEAKTMAVGKLRVSDLVLTHRNRLKSVTAISYSLKELLTINTPAGPIKVSPEHRLLAYNKVTKEFVWIEAGSLKSDVHQLVRSTLVDVLHAEIVTIKEIDNGLLHISYDLKGDTEAYESTTSHKFSVFDMTDLSYKTVTA